MCHLGVCTTTTLQYHMFCAMHDPYVLGTSQHVYSWLKQVTVIYLSAYLTASCLIVHININVYPTLCYSVSCMTTALFLLYHTWQSLSYNELHISYSRDYCGTTNGSKWFILYYCCERHKIYYCNDHLLRYSDRVFGLKIKPLIIYFLQLLIYGFYWNPK